MEKKVGQKRANEAADEARRLMYQNALVQVSVAAMVTARQFYTLVADALNEALVRGDIQDAELVSDTLQYNVLQEGEKPRTAAELQTALLETCVPLLDVLQQQVDLQANEQAENRGRIEAPVRPAATGDNDGTQ